MEALALGLGVSCSSCVLAVVLAVVLMMVVAKKNGTTTPVVPVVPVVPSGQQSQPSRPGPQKVRLRSDGLYLNATGPCGTKWIALGSDATQTWSFVSVAGKTGYLLQKQGCAEGKSRYLGYNTDVSGAATGFTDLALNIARTLTFQICNSSGVPDPSARTRVTLRLENTNHFLQPGGAGSLNLMATGVGGAVRFDIQ